VVNSLTSVPYLQVDFLWEFYFSCRFCLLDLCRTFEASRCHYWLSAPLFTGASSPWNAVLCEWTILQLLVLLFYSVSIRWTGTQILNPCSLSSGMKLICM
jgi:hypothetical protein